VNYTIGETLRVKGVQGVESVTVNDLIDIFAPALIGEGGEAKQFSCVPPVIVRVNTELGQKLGIIRSISKKPDGDLRVQVAIGTSTSIAVVGTEKLEFPSRLFL
jgi:hypothetical protein